MGSSMCVDFVREEEPAHIDPSVVESDQKTLPVCKSFTRVAEPLIIVSYPCGELTRGKHPQLIDQRMGESEQRNLPVNRSSNQIGKLLFMVFCLCVEFKMG